MLFLNGLTNSDKLILGLKPGEQYLRYNHDENMPLKTVKLFGCPTF